MAAPTRTANVTPTRRPALRVMAASTGRECANSMKDAMIVVCATLRDAADGVALSNIKPAYGFVSIVVVNTIAMSAGNPIMVTIGAIATFNQ